MLYIGAAVEVEVFMNPTPNEASACLLLIGSLKASELDLASHLTCGH
jgi:hypothetical protein